MMVSHCPVVMFYMSLMFITCFGYRFGIGIYDITGPAADVNMLGYAKLSQTTSGIHLRLFSRAFVIQEDENSRPILFISLDVGMASQLLKIEVVKGLKSVFGTVFDETNVLLSATHTHSGPGGFFQYFLYDITSLGLVKANLEVMVTGIIESVQMAWKNRMDGKILIAQGLLTNASINRSPASYEMNPKEEREKYEANVDQQMILLKFVDLNGKAVGMLNWFSVHAVSMNNTNTLISSDNKGLASILFEQRMNGERLLGKGPFVAAFAQANEGDVSPNIAGPRCIDTGLPCDMIHTTCGGRAEKCIAFGPGSDMFESTKIIAQRQMEKAWELFNEATEELTGPVSFVQQYVDMTSVKVTYGNVSGTTCKPAMGYSFAAGTMDGPGDFDFTQGSKSGKPFWDFVRNSIKKPSKELSDCQAPKPVLLATGEIDRPVPWQPKIVDTQMLRIGNLFIAALPGEFTTMSGRRVREAIQKVVRQFFEQSDGGSKSDSSFYVALAGLSNIYTSYIATPEEYQLQRYEGASTIYGPLTLPAYVDQFTKLAIALMQGEHTLPGPTPPEYKDHIPTFLPGVLYDSTPFWHNFGDVLVEPLDKYEDPNATVVVEFVSACPRNDVRLNNTFLTVERFNRETNQWVVLFTDANWETKFHWTRDGLLNFFLGQSKAIITWQVTDVNGKCHPGTYRICHFGTSKAAFSGNLKKFSGSSKSFIVTCGLNRSV